MSTIWVQHMSGVGQKWKVICECEFKWEVEAIREGEGLGDYLYLPKWEYVKCEPPVEWQDVTGFYAFARGRHDVTLEPGDALRFQDGQLRIMRKVSEI